MKIISKSLIIGVVFFASIQISFASIEYCYPDGCATIRAGGHGSDAGHLALINSFNYTSLYQLSDFFRGAWGYGGQGSRELVPLACGNGSTFTPFIKKCANGATNYPACNICSGGSIMQNGQCLVCQNGGCTNYSCNNGAVNPPSCSQCPTSSTMQNGQCTCTNNATVQSSCSQCAQGYTFDKNQCVLSCTLTNVCNQTSQGVMRNGVCSTPSGDNSTINNSCITTFSSSSGSVNPNGSVEFRWSMATLPNNVGSRCGFVDLTTPTPRPIPGLQNLDPSQDRTRISNIQSSTRFCLICQFYNLLNNSSLGNAAAHQWVRVIRVGEN